MANTPSFNWETPDDTDLVKDGAAAIRTLGNAIDSSMTDLKGGTSGQVLSKNSNTDMDFVWVTSDDANAIQNAIVDAKGDLISATAADTPARLAVGNNGETLVADSSATTGLRWQGSQAAGKNAVINGGFDIWQRGTASSTASGAYGADRWYSYTATNVNYQRETLAVGSPTTYGIKYTSTSGTNSVLFGTALEDIVANQLRGQNVTLSFYAYCSTGTVSLVSYIQKNSTANSATVASWATISNPTNTVTTTAQRFTVSNVAIAADSTTAGIRILFGADNFTNGANFVIYGVQLEIGAVATPFSRAGGTLAGELAACQRYLPAFTASGNNSILGFASSTTKSYVYFKLPVTARVAPTGITVSNVTHFNLYNKGFAGGAPTAIAFDTAGPDMGYLGITTTAGSPTIAQGEPASLQFNSASALILFTGCEL